MTEEKAMKNQDEMLEALETDGIIKKEGHLWSAGPKYELLTKPFSEGLTEENDVEVKRSLLAMSVRFLKRGKNWTVQRVGSAEGVEHIIISTQPVTNANFTYQKPEPKEEAEE